MPPLTRLAWRLPIALCGIGAVAAGLVFIAAAGPGGGGQAVSAVSGAGAASPGLVPSPSPTGAATTPPPAAAEPGTSPESAIDAGTEAVTPAGEDSTSDNVATATPGRSQPPTTRSTATATAPSIQLPTATPIPADSPSPVADLPAYRDTVVLGLAASAILPGGHTFRACVDSAPGGEGWPLAVHLYYLGHGEWVVETHVSEVAVIFTEATATFRVSSYHPVGPDC